jgi:hypothetical protein
LIDLQEYYPYIFIVGGVVLLFYGLIKNNNKADLKNKGIKVEGIIFKQEYQQNSSNYTIENPLIKDKIIIRFVTLSQEWITAPIDQDFQMFYNSLYKDRESVTLYYDKDNPQIFYVETKQSELLVRVLFSFIGIIFISYGIYKYIFP